MSDVDPRLVAATREQLSPDNDYQRAVAFGPLPGDRVITGYVVNTSIRSGDEITADLGSVGRVSLRVA